MKIKATDLEGQLRGTIGLAREYFVMAISEPKEMDVDLDMIAGASLLSKIEIPDEPSSACINLRKPTFPCTKKDKHQIASSVYNNLMRALSTIDNDEKTIDFVIKAKQAYNTMYGLL